MAPTSVPVVALSAAPLPRAHLGVVRVLHGPLVVLLGLAGVAQAVVAAVVAHRLGSLRDHLVEAAVARRTVDVRDWQPPGGAVALSVAAVSFVALVVWSTAAYANLRRLAVHPRRTIGWAAVVWCIPLAQPSLRRVLAELEVGSHPATALGWSDQRGTGGSLLVSTWWTALTLAWIFGLSGAGLLHHDGATPQAAGYAVWSLCASAALGSVASVCAAVFVHRVSADQQARLTRLVDCGMVRAG